MTTLLSFREIKKICLGIEVENPEDNSNGVLIREVENGSPAVKAGLKKGDLIMEIVFII